MAMVITSFTPTTGPASGGTEVTVTGTGLNTCEAVLVGPSEAEIVGTPTATTVVFRTPAGAVGNADVNLFDGTNVVKAATPFAYVAVPASDPLVSTLAGKMALDVRVVGDAEFTRVRGVTTIKDNRAFNTEDDSDTDSGLDTEDMVTGRSRQVTGTVKRGKGRTSGAYDPGQEIIRTACDAIGTPDGLIEARWYDRTGGPEAYQGYVLPQWSPQGGNKTSDKVDFTLGAQGIVATITNPVIADPTLAGPYAS